MTNKTNVMIVEARFYEDVSDYLLGGAIAALEVAECAYEVFQVPGALEIPSAIALGAGSGKYDAYVALGCVIRGETAHYDIVAHETARGLMDLSIQKNLPIGNGVLTCDTYEQAVTRADPAQKNKGAHAVQAALALLRMKRGLA